MPKSRDNDLRGNPPESSEFKEFMKVAFPKEARLGALAVTGALAANLAVLAGVLAYVEANSDQETFECLVDLYARGNSIYSQDGSDPCADMRTITAPDGTLYTTEPEAAH